MKSSTSFCRYAAKNRLRRYLINSRPSHSNVLELKEFENWQLPSLGSRNRPFRNRPTFLVARGGGSAPPTQPFDVFYHSAVFAPYLRSHGRLANENGGGSLDCFAIQLPARIGARNFVNNDQYAELARLLEGDLDELVELCFPHNKPVAEAKIRQTAVILRRWLLDGDLQRLLDPLRLSARFYVQDNGPTKAYLDRTPGFRYLLTANVMMSGRPIRYIYDTALDPAEVEHDAFKARWIGLSLKKFLAQPRIFHEGQWFSTGQIVRFVANKLGGNHVDFDRGGEWEHLDRANKYFKYGGPALTQPPSGATLYLQFEPASVEVIGGAHVELIAAAASFVQMEIGGTPLRQLTSKSSLANELRKFFQRVPPITLVERE